MATVSTIGTTGDYATLADWLLLKVPDPLDDDYVAELLPEAHSANITIAKISGVYSLTIRPHATAPYHYGLASNVSGVFSATLEPEVGTSPLISIANCDLNIYGIEFITYQDYAQPVITTATSDACTLTIYRNIFRGIAQGTPSSSNRGVVVNETDVTINYYRNISYNLGGAALQVVNMADNARVVHNTAYYCGNAGGTSNFLLGNGSVATGAQCRNNVSIYPASTSTDYTRTGTWTWGPNYRTTAGGGGGAGTTTLTSPGTEFERATSTYTEGQTRLLLAQGAQMLAVGSPTYGTTYFPAIRLNNQYPPGSTNPDVGADEYEPDRGDRPWGYRPWMDTRRIGIRGNRPGYYDEAPGWP